MSKVVTDAPAGLSAATARRIGDSLGAARIAPFDGGAARVGTVFRD